MLVRVEHIHIILILIKVLHNVRLERIQLREQVHVQTVQLESIHHQQEQAHVQTVQVVKHLQQEVVVVKLLKYVQPDVIGYIMESALIAYLIDAIVIVLAMVGHGLTLMDTGALKEAGIIQKQKRSIVVGQD